ncbi:MAG: glycosyltransferase family 4 protein [Myxococcota bacterium]|nr:glycosyltransferase family 4 protein [Myxococcota bacterium]
MRISILSHSSNRFSEIYARSFRDRGHQVQFLSLEDQPLEIEDVEVRIVVPAGFRPLETSARIHYLAAVPRARREIRAFRPDLLFGLYLNSAGLIARLADHPRTIISARGSDVYLHRGKFPWPRVFRWMARGSVRVHAVSEPLRKILVDEMHIPKSKVFVCPLGIDSTRLPEIRFEQRPAEGELLVTRGHGRTHDQQTILEALLRLQSRGVRARVTFAHAGPGVEATRNAAERLGLADQVRFVPGYHQNELPALLTGCDAYVSASLHDGTSSSLLEALCSATPVVVSDIAANRSWIRHGREGLLFPPGDPEALAGSLERVITDPELRRRIGAGGRRIVLEKAERAAHMDQLVEIFSSLP